MPAVALPFFVAFEFLGAFIETLGYVTVVLSLALGIVNVSFAVLFFAIAVLSGVFLSLTAVLLEDLAFRRFERNGELLQLVAYSVAENFGYRQLMTSYRVRGFFAYLRGNKAWGEIRRVGFSEIATSTPEARTRDRV